MASIKMNVERRTEVGSNRVNKMRVKNLIPGVIYSRGEETQHIMVESVEFLKVYRNVGTSTMFDVVIDGESQPVIIKEIQKHPFKNQYMHIDLQKLNMDETIRMNTFLFHTFLSLQVMRKKIKLFFQERSSTKSNNNKQLKTKNHT